MWSSVGTEGWCGGCAAPMVTCMEEQTDKTPEPAKDRSAGSDEAAKPKRVEQAPGEVGGPEGPEPTRYGDWERNGRVSDF